MEPRRTFDHISKDGKQVFSLLQKNGPRLMELLEKEELIIEVDMGESSGGRKPVLYNLDTKRFYVLGVDISQLYTEIVIADPKMNVLNKKTFNMDETFTPEKTVQTIASLFQESLSQLGIDRKKFLGVGLGTVGPLNGSAGIVINFQHQHLRPQTNRVKTSPI